MIESIILIIAGFVNFALALAIITLKDFGKKYVATSPKAYIWRKIFGEDRAYEIIKKYFGPAGLVIGVIFMILGVYFAYIAFQGNYPTEETACLGLDRTSRDELKIFRILF